MSEPVIPSEYMAGLLRQYSPNDFVLSYRKYNPNVQLPSAGQELDGIKRVDISLTGSTNEFALMDQAFLNITASGSIKAKVDTADTLFVNYNNTYLNKRSAATAPCFKWGGANRLISSSVESYNANSLKLYENRSESAVVNTFRALMTRSPAQIENDELFDVPDDIYWNNLSIGRLESAGFCGTQSRARGVSVNYDWVETNPPTNPPAFSAGVGQANIPTGLIRAGVIPLFSGSVNLFKAVQPITYKVPLGQFSTLANTTMALPLGLISNLNITGMMLSFNFGGSGKALQIPSLGTVDVANQGLVKMSNNNFQLTNAEPVSTLYDVSLVVPVITVFNPMLMETILNTYRGQQSVMIGGTPVPMSLRFNTINYNTWSFPIEVSSGWQRFTLPLSDKSVRAIGWMIYRDDQADIDGYQISASTATDKAVSDRSPLNYPLLSDKIAVDGLRVDFGRNNFLPSIENMTPNDDNVDQFCFDQIKKCGWVFSMFPYWSEVDSRETGPEDLIFRNKKRSDDQLSLGNNTFNGQLGYDGRSYRNINYGCVSLMNSEVRGSSDARVASGMSFNSIGRIDVSMKFSKRDTDSTYKGQPTLQPIDKGYRIVFIRAFDEVISSTSSAGMQIITDSVLP